MTLRDLIAADTDAVLMNTEDFAEVLSFQYDDQPAIEVTGVMSTGGPVEYEIVDAEGFLTKVEIVDWQIRLAEFDSMPESGRLTRADGSQYELLPVGKLPAVQVLDDFGGQLVLHTKKVRNA
jgi:hypothetical protein